MDKLLGKERLKTSTIADNIDMFSRCPLCLDEKFYLYNFLSDKLKLEFITIHETSNFLVIPDIAPLIEGHLLIIPKKHYLCIGELEKRDLYELANLKTYVSNLVSKTYGKKIFFEHGPSFYKQCGNCIDHAHLHCLPLDIDISNKIDTKIKGEKIPSITKLADLYKKDTPYLFFETNQGLKYVYPLMNEQTIPSQYLRILISDEMSLKNWNWREIFKSESYRHENKKNIVKAITDLRCI